jgi:sugar/nucleoside kinase (ribokinase family)
MQRKVLAQARERQLVVADTMNFWIETQRDELYDLLREVDGLVLNDGEARMLTDEINLVRAGRKVLDLGPLFVIIKKGEHGAMFLSAAETFTMPAFPLADVVDPTGAGDSFAGGFLGLLDRTGGSDLSALRQAVVMGCTIASFTVEAFSLDRLRDLTLAEVRSRFETFRKLTDYEALHASIG